MWIVSHTASHIVHNGGMWMKIEGEMKKEIGWCTEKERKKWEMRKMNRKVQVHMKDEKRTKLWIYGCAWLWEFEMKWTHLWIKEKWNKTLEREEKQKKYIKWNFRRAKRAFFRFVAIWEIMVHARPAKEVAAWTTHSVQV